MVGRIKGREVCSGIVIVKIGALSWVSIQQLEIVPVQVEWMGTGVLVTENDLDYLILFEHYGMGVVPVDS